MRRPDRHCGVPPRPALAVRNRTPRSSCGGSEAGTAAASCAAVAATTRDRSPQPASPPSSASWSSATSSRRRRRVGDTDGAGDTMATGLRLAVSRRHRIWNVRNKFRPSSGASGDLPCPRQRRGQTKWNRYRPRKLDRADQSRHIWRQRRCRAGEYNATASPTSRSTAVNGVGLGG